MAKCRVKGAKHHSSKVVKMATGGAVGYGSPKDNVTGGIAGESFNGGKAVGGTSSVGSGGGGGSGGASGNLGLTTGKTIYGNTAFGLPGGNALGYATASNGGKSNIYGPSVQKYSNFKNLNGSQMFAGNPSIKSTSGMKGYNTLNAQQQARRAKPAAPDVTTQPITQKPKVKKPVEVGLPQKPKPPAYNKSTYGGTPNPFSWGNRYDASKSPDTVRAYRSGTNSSTMNKNNPGSAGTGGSSTQYKDNYARGGSVKRGKK